MTHPPAASMRQPRLASFCALVCSLLLLLLSFSPSSFVSGVLMSPACSVGNITTIGFVDANHTTSVTYLTACPASGTPQLVYLPYPMSVWKLRVNSTGGAVSIVDEFGNGMEVLGAAGNVDSVGAYPCNFGASWYIDQPFGTPVTEFYFQQLPPDLRNVSVTTYNYKSGAWNTMPSTTRTLSGPMSYDLGRVDSPNIQLLVFGSTSFTRSDTPAPISVYWVEGGETRTVLNTSSPLQFDGLDFGTNTFMVNSSWDYNGLYNFTVFYTEFSALSLYGYQGATISNGSSPTVDLSTASTASTLLTDQIITLNRAGRDCTVNVSYATTTLSAYALVTQSTQLRLNVSNSMYGYQSLLFNNGSASVSTSPALLLAVGENIVSVENTREEIYWCVVNRMPSRLVSVTVDGWRANNAYLVAQGSAPAYSTANNTDLASSSTVFQLSSGALPAFSNSLRSYNLTVGSKWSYIGFRVALLAGSTDTLTLSVDGVVVSTFAAGVASAPGSPPLGTAAVALTPNATTVLTINSAHDGNYSYRIHRNAVDLTGLWAVPHRAGVNSSFTPLTLAGGVSGATSFASNPLVAWSANLTMGASDIQILASFRSASNVVKVASDGYALQTLASYDGVSAPSTSLYSPWSDTITTFVVSSSEDGDFVLQVYTPFEVNRVRLLSMGGADIPQGLNASSLALAGSNVASIVNFATQGLPMDLGADLVTLDRMDMPCMASVNYSQTTLVAYADVSISPFLRLNVSSDSYGNQSMLFANGTTVSNPAMLLAVGDNIVSVENTRGEVYYCIVTRMAPRISSLTLDGWRPNHAYYVAQGRPAWLSSNNSFVASANPYSGFMSPPRPFVFANDLRKYEITVGSKWSLASLRVSSASLGDVLMVVTSAGTNATIVSTTSGAPSSPPAESLSLPNSTVVWLTLVSASDGNYSIRLYRNDRSLTGLYLHGEDLGTSADLYPWSLSASGSSLPLVNAVGFSYAQQLTTLSANATYWKDVLKVVYIWSGTNSLMISSSIAGGPTLSTASWPAAFPDPTAYTGKWNLPPGGAPGANPSVFTVSSSEDGEFVFLVRHVPATVDMNAITYFGGGSTYWDYAPVSIDDYPQFCGAPMPRVGVNLTGMNIPTNPGVELVITVGSFPGGGEPTRPGAVRLLCSAANPCNTLVTTADGLQPSLDFRTSNSDQYFQMEFAECSSSYTTWFNYSLRGVGIDNFLPYDDATIMSRQVTVRPRASVNATIVSNPSDPTNSGIFFSGTSWTVRLDLSEAPLTNFELNIRVDVACEPMPGSSAPLVTTGSNCGSSWLSTTLDEFIWTDPTLRLFTIMAPKGLTSPQVLRLNVSFVGSDQWHYRSSNFSWMVQPGVVIATPPFHNMTLGETHSVLVTLPSPVLADLTFNISIFQADGVTPYAGLVTSGQSVSLTAGVTSFTFTWTAPSVFTSVVIAFAVDGTDQFRFRAPAPLPLRVGILGSVILSGVPTKAITNSQFQIGVHLSEAPFGGLGATFTITAVAANGATVVGSSSATFGTADWMNVVYFTFQAPPAQAYITPLRAAGHHSVHTMAAGPWSASTNPDPTFTITWLYSGSMPAQFAPLPPLTVGMLTAVMFGGFPSFLYLRQTASIAVTFVGATHGEVSLDVTAKASPALGIQDDSAITGLVVQSGALAPFTFMIQAPSTLPGSFNNNSFLLLNWNLSGIEAWRFAVVTNPLLPSMNLSIPLRNLASIGVVGMPTAMYAGDTTGLVTIRLTEPVNYGAGALEITITAMSSSSSTSPAAAGYTSVGSVTIQEGYSTGSFLYTSPSGVSDTITISYSKTAGSDLEHYAAPIPASVITVQPKASFVVTASNSAALAPGEPLVITVRPSGPPLPGTLIALQVTVTGLAVATPRTVWFSSSNYSSSVNITISAPAAETTQAFDVSFNVLGSGAVGFSAPVFQRIIVLPAPSSTSSFQSSTGSLGAPIVTVERNKDSIPFWLWIIVAALGVAVCVGFFAVVALCSRKSEDGRKLKSMQSEVFQPVVAEEAPASAAAGAGATGTKVSSSSPLASGGAAPISASPTAAAGAGQQKEGSPSRDQFGRQQTQSGLAVAVPPSSPGGGGAIELASPSAAPASQAQASPTSPAPRVTAQYAQPQSAQRAGGAGAPAAGAGRPALGNPSPALGNPKPAPYKPAAAPAVAAAAAAAPPQQRNPSPPPAAASQPPVQFHALDVQPEHTAGGDHEPLNAAGGADSADPYWNNNNAASSPSPLLTEVPPHLRQGPGPRGPPQQRGPMQQQGGQYRGPPPQGQGQQQPPFNRAPSGPGMQQRPASPYGSGPQGPPGQQRPNMAPRQNTMPPQQGPRPMGPPQGQQYQSQGRAGNPHHPQQQGGPGAAYRSASPPPQQRAASPQGRMGPGPQGPNPHMRAASPPGRAASPQGRMGPGPNNYPSQGPPPQQHYQYGPSSPQAQGGPRPGPGGQGGFPVQRVASMGGPGAPGPQQGGAPMNQPPVSRLQSTPGNRGLPPPQARAASRPNLNAMIQDVSGGGWASGAAPQQGSPTGAQQGQGQMRRPGPGPQQR